MTNTTKPTPKRIGKEGGTARTVSNDKYASKTYDRIVVKVRKDTAAAFKAKCEQDGIPYSQVLHAAIEQYLRKE